MSQFFIGLCLVVSGLALIVFREKIKNLTGNIGFAEEYLGVGGTWTFYLILGIALFVLGLMWWSGAFQVGFEGLFGGFF
ncbi:MAG: hypothetical protein ABII07_00100 [Patescibacteria group bacterium]|nr:hypothetical protein [Patescibacteria group bacterium]